MATRIPAPSPVFFSQPQAPLCAMRTSISIASVTCTESAEQSVKIPQFRIGRELCSTFCISNYYTIAFDSRCSITSKDRCVPPDQIEKLKCRVLEPRVQGYNSGTSLQIALQQQLMPRYSNFQELISKGNTIYSQFTSIKLSTTEVRLHGKQRIAAHLATANPLVF